jgi:hypothetical protein
MTTAYIHISLELRKAPNRFRIGWDEELEYPWGPTQCMLLVLLSHSHCAFFLRITRVQI